MPGPIQELVDYLDSEALKKESKQFKTGRIRTFLREYYRINRPFIDSVADHYILLHNIYASYPEKSCKEPYFTSVAKKTYSVILRDDNYYIDLSRQRITKSRKPSSENV
jgi:hypothetical protein